MPVLADGRFNWLGAANKQARFKVQVEVQLLRQTPCPSPLLPLPNTYATVGGLITLDTGRFYVPGAADYKIAFIENTTRTSALCLCRPHAVVLGP